MGYWLLTAGGAAAFAALYAIRLKGRCLPLALLPVTVVFCAVLGLVGAKLGYCLLMCNVAFPRYGLAALIRTESSEFSFVCGCLGACLGVLAAARSCRCPASRVLDAFAPAGAVMAAALRLGEYFLGWLGLGKYVDQGWQQFFPLSVQNKYGEWYTAVFVLEAAAALAVAVIALCLDRKKGPVFSRVAFYLALPQIFFESLRALTLKWGFVRVEQVLCGVIVTALVAWHCLKSGRGGARRFLPVGGMLLCIAVMVGVEFALDKSDIPYLVCYGVMILALLAMAALEIYCVRRKKA